MGNGPICISAVEPDSYEAAFCLLGFLVDLAENSCVLLFWIDLSTYRFWVKYVPILLASIEKKIFLSTLSKEMVQNRLIFVEPSSLEVRHPTALCLGRLNSVLRLNPPQKPSEEIGAFCYCWDLLVLSQDGESVLRGIVGLSVVQRLFPPRAMSLDGLLKVSFTNSSTSFERVRVPDLFPQAVIWWTNLDHFLASSWVTRFFPLLAWVDFMWGSKGDPHGFLGRCRHRNL